MTNGKEGEASPTTTKVTLALMVVLAVLAAPVVSYLGQARETAVFSPPKLAVVKSARTRSLQLDSLIVEMSDMLADRNSTHDQIRSLAATISAHADLGRDALLRLLQEWNHPVLLETAGGYGSQAREVLPHLEALLDFLELGCNRAEPTAEIARWMLQHVDCQNRVVLRRQVLWAYVDIKFSSDQQTTKNWSKSIEELNSALSTAVERDRLGAAKSLLAMGANPNWVALIPDPNGPPDSPPIDCTIPLKSALHARSRAMIDLLLTVGAEPSNRACSPIVFAVDQREHELLDMLIKGGARPNGLDFQGRSPLIAAVRNNDEKAVKLLLAAGASPHARSLEGVSAYEVAVEQNHSVFMQLFEQLDSPIAGMTAGSATTR
jgi:Ankyrin repeats (3 copies)